MNTNHQEHLSLHIENQGNVDIFSLTPGVSISFNQIFTDSWTKGDSSIYSDRMLIINFCINGRCEATLTGNRYAIVGEKQLCISTNIPVKDFYYPGSLYEGIQLYIDLTYLKQLNGNDLLSQMGINVENIVEIYCQKSGLYLQQINDVLLEIVNQIWNTKDEPELGLLRYYSVRLLHELTDMPRYGESNTFFTKSQIAIVKETEALIMNDLSKRYTAKDLADRFGVSESSFKLYIKGILGDSYLSYFRKKRMERAAYLLETTNMKVIDIANSVGYENQGKFAKVFAEKYGASPLEFRRLSK